MSDRECAPLEGTQQCQAWAEGHRFNETAIIVGLQNSPSGRVNGHDITLPPTVENFDEFVSIFSWSASDTSKEHFRRLFRCPGWNGAGLRYATTYNCLYTLYTASATCNGAAERRGLCANTCNAFISSIAAVLDSSASCPDQSEEARTQRRDILAQYRVGCMADASFNCVTGNQADLLTCGFGSQPSQLASARSYCIRNTSDPCCVTFSSYLKARDIHLAQQDDSDGSDVSQLSGIALVAVILGAIVGAALLAAACIAALRWHRRRRERANEFDASHWDTVTTPVSPPVSRPAGPRMPAASQQQLRRLLDDDDDDLPSLASSTGSLRDSRPLQRSTRGVVAEVLSRSSGSDSHSGIAGRSAYEPRPRERVRFNDHVEMRDLSLRSSHPSAFEGLSQSEDTDACLCDDPSSNPVASYPAVATNTAAQPPSLFPHAFCIVYGYEPQLGDEVRVMPGDMATVHRIFPEGWCYVHNISRQKWGMAPLDCFGGAIRPGFA